MKFPRNARIFRGRLDAAPYVTVLFLLAMFLLLLSLVYTPGVHVQLPVADNLPGTDKPSVSVAIDRNGRYYYENQSIEEAELRRKLHHAAQASPVPLTLVVQADRLATLDMFLHMALLARDAGIQDVLLATLPRPLAAAPLRAPP
jgi:biopolymer transport protein ExbD